MASKPIIVTTTSP